MKTTIFVAITIAALGAVGVTTSIVSSGIPVYAQGGPGAPQCAANNQHAPPGTMCTNGPQPEGSLLTDGRTTSHVGGVLFSDNGNIAGSGGGSVSGTACSGEGGPGCQTTLTKCVGSPGFQTAVKDTFPGTTTCAHASG